MLPRNRFINRFAKRSLVALAATSATAGLCDSVFAQSGSWTYNGNDNWSNSAVWFGNIIPDGADNVAGLGLGVNVLDTLTVTLDTNRTIGAVTFADSDAVNTPAGWVLKSLGAQVLTLQTTTGFAPIVTANTLGAGNGTSQIGTLFQKISQVSANLAGTQGIQKNGTGTLVLSGNNGGLSGSSTITQGILVLNSANALGGITDLTLRTGQMAFRGDTASNYSGTSITLQSDSTFGTGNAITLGAQYGVGSNLVHTIGNVTVDTYGVRTLGISGSNGYGLNMGRLTLRDGITLINQGGAGSINGAGSNNNVIDAGSGLVTIGTITYGGPGAGTIELGGIGTYAGNITVTNGITNTGGGSAALVYSGSKTLTLNGAIGTGGDTYVTGDTTGTVAALNYQAGVGTMIANVGALPSGKSVTINGGTLLLNAATTHTIGGLTMGGATLTTGPVPAYLGTGAGTAALAGNIIVNDSILFDTGTTTGSAVATAGSLTGRLDLGGSTRGIAVNGSSTLTIGAVVNGSGGITKTGTGALNFTNINTFTGAINIVDGVVGGTAAAAGNSLGSTGANISLGGALRVNGLAGVGTTTVNTLTSKDSGGNEGLIVDATLGGTTTLTINSYGGRELGTHGTIKVVPVTGQLNTKEIVRMATGAPLPTNGMLPAYFAVQNSGSDTQLNFASVTSNQIVAFNGYSSGTVNINTTGASTVYNQTATEAMTGGRQVFGLKIGANASLTGAQALTLGNGTTGFGGLIMNGGVLVNNGSITTLGTDELVFWSGGANPNTVASNINFNGDLTTGGSQAIELSGVMNFNGAPRNLTVTGGTATLSNGVALSGATGFNKRGGGVLAVTGDNATYTGPTSILSGTLQLGAGGSTGRVGTGAITNNANLSFNGLDPTGLTSGSFGNSIGGSGDLWVNPSSTGIISLSGPLTYTGNTTVQTGTLKLPNSANRLPATTGLRVEGGSTFDVGGFGVTVASLSGSGTITNSVLGNPTLTVNGGGTFSGSIRNGTGSIALMKTGPGTLVLDGANAFSGTISITGGTLQVNSAAASSSGGGNNPNIVLSDAALTINHNANMTNANLFFLGSSTISVISNPPVVLGVEYDGAGPGINSGANSWQGSGTVNFVLNGRAMNIGDTGAGGGNIAILNSFSGTLKFDDNNPVGSRIRMGLGVANYTAGSTSATFAFGNGNLVMNHRNGSAIFNMGYVSGGTNTILEGHGNGGGRPQTYNFGFMTGDQTYHGQIRDYNTNGGNGIVNIAKYGSSSTLTLKNTLSFTGGVTVNEGTLFFGAGANITNAASLVINAGTLSILPGASITSNRIIATLNGGQITGGINVASTPGFSTPGRLTFIGGGTVYGSVNHNAGSINPGAIGGAGTLTFANNLNVNNGSVDFDLTAGSTNLLGTSGSGSNDVLQINASNGLTLSSGIIRLNFLGAGTTPPPSLAVNQFYPIIKYSGTYTGATSSIFTTAKFRGSFGLVEGTGSLAGTLGAKVFALGGATNSLVWKPISTEFNAWDAAVGFTNFKPLVGAGSLFFFNGDSVTFDDTTTIRTVQLTPDLAPTSITVNTSNTYIFTGQGFGSIVGSTGLVKNGTGTLFLAGNNTFTGGITVNGGTLVDGDPFSNQLSRQAFSNGTVIFNNNSGFRFLSPGPNTFSGPDNGTFVLNPGQHNIYIPSSNQTVVWSTNFVGTGTLVAVRPSLDGANSNITFQADDWVSFSGTLKADDLTNFLAGSNQGAAQLRDGTIFRHNAATGGSPSMTLDLGGVLSQAGFTLGGANQTFTMGALRGGPNTFLKQDGNNAAGTFVIGGNAASYSSTFDGIIKASTGGSTLSAAIQLVNVVKAGSFSTLTLTQLQPYVGSTIVNGGTLALSNASSNPLSSPTITIATGAALDISGLNAGELVLNGNQRLFSNGNIVGSQVSAVSTSTVGGTQIAVPLVVADGATISPGPSDASVGSLTVTDLTMGAAQFLIEVNQTGIDSLVLAGTQVAPILQSNPGITLVNLGGFVPGTYTFLDYDGNPSIQTGIENGFTFQPFAYEVKLIHDCANTRVLMQFTNNSAQWFVNSNGTWSTASNWTLDGTNPSLIVPNSVTFGTFISAPRTVNVNGATGNVTNSIVFDSPQSYTIAGPGTLTLDSGITAPITVLQGNHAINAPVRALRTLGVSVNPGLTLSFGGTINGQNNAGITKIGSGTASFTQFNLPGGTINVGAGSMLLTQKASPNASEGTSLALGLTVAAGAKLNLTNNALILDSGSAASVGAQLVELRAELADGRLFSSTTASNTTLGYRSNNTGTTAAAGTGTAGQGLGAVATFAGVGVDNTSVLIRVTYKGDSNLDGVVNVLDLVNLALNWQSTNGVWAGGDFNYDGLVNSSDLAILAQGWQLGNNNPLPSDDIGAALTAAGVPLSAVPEPTTAALIGLGGLGLLGRRRRRE